MNDEFNSCWVGERLLPLGNMCINSFRAHGFGFNLYTYNPVQDVPEFACQRDATAIVPKERIFEAHGGVETFCDLFAYNFLESSGGWWVDNDVLCNTDKAPDVEIAFAEERIGIINNAVLKFPKRHPAILKLLDYISQVDPVNGPWGATGPLALTKVFNELGLKHDFKISDFYPLHWKETPKLLFPEFTNEVIEKIADAPFVHLWGATLREIGFNYTVPLKGSYMDILHSKYLDPQVAAELRPVDEGKFRTSVKTHVEKDWGVSLPILT
jgi:hypothetical protein